MRKYEEEHYKFENIKDVIYPWVKNELTDTQALNGKHFSEKNTPVIPFVGDLKVVFAIKRGEEQFEILKEKYSNLTFIDNPYYKNQELQSFRLKEQK